MYSGTTGRPAGRWCSRWTAWLVHLSRINKGTGRPRQEWRPGPPSPAEAEAVVLPGRPGDTHRTAHSEALEAAGKCGLSSRTWRAKTLAGESGRSEAEFPFGALARSEYWARAEDPGCGFGQGSLRGRGHSRTLGSVGSWREDRSQEEGGETKPDTGPVPHLVLRGQAVRD